MVSLSDHDDSATTTISYTDPIYDVYDVFLSFRGFDTRHGFTDHLYDRLIRADIPTFRDDDELERGEPLKQQLEKAIKQSSVLIIVFSENFASSTWCLDEVVRIVEQKKIRRNQKVLPICYKVESSMVRYQTGTYKRDFDQHIEKGRVSLEKIEAWKAALKEAADLVVLTLHNEYETKFIDKVLSEVIKSLRNRKALDVPDHLVGLSYRTAEINSWLKDGSKDNNVLIIWGIDGLGKTTIAKLFFNEYFQDFDASCFLAWKKTTWDQNEACALQSQLLSSLLNKQREELTIYNCDEGTQKIKRALCNKKVLLVLDDVSEAKQLDALLGQRQEFCPGSKILVTTRNKFLAKHFIGHPMVHELGYLNDEDSLELFSWHAFRQRYPPEEYKHLSEKILLRCDRLPLALILLGSSLRRNLDTVFWERQLQKWNEILDTDIHNVMKICYDSLEDNTVKSLFLHVACFFVGEEEDYIVKILDRRGIHAAVGIQSLTDRCLITINAKKLMMHRVIRDMGREIVRQESPDEPGKRSRLWYHEDSFAVLKYDKGTEVVQGLILNGKKINKVESDESRSVSNFFGYVKKKYEDALGKEGDLKFDVFAKMVNLELVKLNHVHLTGICNKFPEKLRWISWHGFPQEYVPMELPLQNLIAFDLQHSLLKKVWKGYKEVQSLKFLNLSYSQQLYQTPDFRGLKQLERLILKGCSNLVVVCKTIGLLQKLVLLDLRDCKSLRDLPSLPKSIVKMDLSGCGLGGFPREQKNIEPFVWKRIVKFAAPSVATGPVKLLAVLPHLLESLTLKNCNLSDECFPRDFGGLPSLEAMDLSGNLITRLPDCVRNLSISRFRRLKISDCPQLQSVINPPGTLTYMRLYNDRQLEKTKTRQNLRESRLEVDGSADYIEIEGCIKAVHGRNVDRKVIKNLGLESLPEKVVYEFGIFSTLVEGREVPSCFTTYPPIRYTEEREVPFRKSIIYLMSPHLEQWKAPCRMSILYTIPTSSAANKIQGLNICFAVRLKMFQASLPITFLFDLTVCNQTKDCAWTYKYRDNILARLFSKGNGRPNVYLWVSTWKCAGDVLEAGDKLEVYIRISNTLCDYEVKEFGIRMVYEEDDLEDNITSTSTSLERDEEITSDGLLWTDQMNVSFSNYLTPGTTYYLPGQLFYSGDFIEDETSGRVVRFVDWSGLMHNSHSREHYHNLWLM